MFFCSFIMCDVPPLNFFFKSMMCTIYQMPHRYSTWTSKLSQLLGIVSKFLSCNPHVFCNVKCYLCYKSFHFLHRAMIILTSAYACYQKALIISNPQPHSCFTWNLYTLSRGGTSMPCVSTLVCSIMVT